LALPPVLTTPYGETGNRGDETVILPPSTTVGIIYVQKHSRILRSNAHIFTDHIFFFLFFLAFERFYSINLRRQVFTMPVSFNKKSKVCWSVLTLALMSISGLGVKEAEAAAPTRRAIIDAESTSCSFVVVDMTVLIRLWFQWPLKCFRLSLLGWQLAVWTLMLPSQA
jgi:hypothetical protein